MKLLAIGDVTEPRAAQFLKANLSSFQRLHHIDFIIANGENAGFIMGPTPDTARVLFDAGIGCVTGGNHTIQNKYLHQMLEYERRLLRPLNYPPTVPGQGYGIYNVNGYRLLCANILGQVHIEPTLDSPIATIENMLQRESGKYDFAVLDIHAEATGEKLAIAHYFDGRFAAIFGTHTHIQTADEQVLPKGTGYITDIGMCGGSTGILGVKKEIAIDRMVTRMPIKGEPDDGPIVMNGVIFDVDESRGLCRSLRRVSLAE